MLETTHTVIIRVESRLFFNVQQKKKTTDFSYESMNYFFRWFPNKRRDKEFEKMFSWVKKETKILLRLKIQFSTNHLSIFKENAIQY